MSVPQEWKRDDMLTAYVQLTDEEIGQAAAVPIKKKPYIELTHEWIRSADTEVEVKLRPGEEKLSKHNIPAVIGITCSQNLVGKFNVELLNENDFTNITIRATEEAKNAYEKTSFKLLLVVEDDDFKATEATEPQPRELIYNFPAEFARRGEIEAMAPELPKVKFRLIPVSGPTGPASGQ